VRGNGKIINELEAAFRGAGWNVIKGDLGRRLGPLAGPRSIRPAPSSAWKSAWTAKYQNFKAKVAPTSVKNFSAGIPSCWSWSPM